MSKLMRAFGVYCQVQGFRYSTKAIRRQGRACYWTSAEIGTVPQGVRFRSFILSSSSFFSLLPVPVANYFATKSPGNEETPQPATLPLVVSQRFVISITRYLSSRTRARRGGVAYRVSRRGIIPKGVSKVFKAV